MVAAASAFVRHTHEIVVTKSSWSSKDSSNGNDDFYSMPGHCLWIGDECPARASGRTLILLGDYTQMTFS